MPGDEKAGEVVAHYSPGLWPGTCGSTKGLFVPWCHTGMKFRETLPSVLWVGNWVLRGGEEL